jgi:hypothetical protein
MLIINNIFLASCFGILIVTIECSPYYGSDISWKEERVMDKKKTPKKTKNQPIEK